MREAALKVFMKGEQAFFQVFGHMLSSNTLMLDQCPATIAPLRQLVLSEASFLKDEKLFANVVLRWKSLFTEFRSQLIQQNSGDIFRAFFQWYTKHKISLKGAQPSIDEESAQAAVLQQMKEEEGLLRKSAKSTLVEIGGTSYELLQKEVVDGVVSVDYIFFAPLRENPLLDSFCVIFEAGKNPVTCELDYKAIHDQSAVITQLLPSQSPTTRERVNTELARLARIIFPDKLLDILARGNVTHLYISPDSDIAHIPFDSLPVKLSGSKAPLPLYEQFSVSVLSSLRQLLSLKALGSLTNSGKEKQTCSIIGNPNFNLCKPSIESSSIEKLITSLCGYFSISSPTGPILEQLKHSQEEIEYISSHLQSCGLSVQSIVGDEATLSKVLALQSPLLIHVSSHAYGSSGRSVSAFRGNFYDDLKSSAIALAGFNTFSKKQFDQLIPDCGTCQLSPLAIYSMSLQGTKLVFLSACSSGAGTAPVQEAADSLARAFLTAGVETVIASLWPVGDKSCAEISKFFYEKVTTPGIRPSEALSYAKNRFKEVNSQAHDQAQNDWSCCTAFVCYGLDKPLFV